MEEHETRNSPVRYFLFYFSLLALFPLSKYEYVKTEVKLVIGCSYEKEEQQKPDDQHRFSGEHLNIWNQTSPQFI